jgi:arylsulfatase
LILADDLGYSDLGCYGGEIQTPSLDALAEDGLRFTQMYNSARCCPTRASLLTGLYPHQTGIGSFVGNNPDRPHGYRGSLQSNVVTIAEVLKEAGYRTFMTGKWHVNDPLPTKQGFEEFYGFTHGYAVNSWDPEMLTRLPEERPETEYKEGEFFATDAYTDYALKFIQRAQNTNPGSPWFTYVAYQAPHFPLQAPEKDIEKYEGVYQAGWDKLREQRMTRMKKLGVVDGSTRLSHRSSIPIPNLAKEHGVPGNLKNNPPWDLIPEDRQRDLARRMAVYAGMVDNMDQNIGRLVDYLEESGQINNTLIVFLSDNGACAEWGPYGFDLPEERLSTNRRGQGIGGGTPGLPSVLHKGEKLEQLGGPGTGMAYGSGWANLCNTPWSEYKQYTHEGGVATPMIVHWPEGIPRNREGSFEHQTGFVFDVTATCIDAANAIYPTRYEGNTITPLEGRSMIPVFNGNKLSERVYVYEHFGNAAIRKGEWKLVGKDVLNENGLVEHPGWELYNIRKDRSEINDLSGRYPDKVKQLERLFLKEAFNVDVLPKN